MSYVPPIGDATAFRKGVIQLGGDLTGTAATPLIATNAVTEPKLAVSNNPASNQLLSWNGTAMTWVDAPAGTGGGVPATYALGRVRYNAGWPASRPSGYAYIDWIKNAATDPDPSASLMIPGDTISEWQ